MAQNCPLHEELLFYEILPRLPTKSLIRFKSVSKTWLSRISQDSLLIATKHTTREEPGTLIQVPYEADEGRIGRLFFLGPDESNLVEIDTSYLWKKNPEQTQTAISLIGSCNGLVCLRLLSLHAAYPLVLWNPATREVNYLPDAAVSPSWHKSLVSYALGFDTRTGVHKVVMLEMVMTEDDLFKANAHIISSNNSGSWKDLNSLTGGISPYDFEEGLTFDGVIYWTAHTPIHFPNPFRVLSFDLIKEEFREFDGPLCRVDDGHIMGFFDLELINWKGSLGAVLIEPHGTKIQFWLKNSDNGWKKISTIEPSIGSVILGGVFRDQIILYCPFTRNRFLYDLVSEEKRELEGEFEGALKKVIQYQICDHFRTLTSPN